MHRKYKERGLYYFICADCGHRATSFKRKRVKAELCRNCRVSPIDPSQQVLFPIPKDMFKDIKLKVTM